MKKCLFLFFILLFGQLYSSSFLEMFRGKTEDKEKVVVTISELQEMVKEGVSTALEGYVFRRAVGKVVDNSLGGYVTKDQCRKAKKSIKSRMELIKQRQDSLEKTMRCFILESQANCASFLSRICPLNAHQRNTLQGKVDAFNREVGKNYQLGDIVFYDHQIIKNERGLL